MNPVTDEKRTGALWGTFIGDALAMPVHWYYDRAALRRDYGIVRDYLAPRNPHPDSILWRSAYTPLNERGDILHEQAQYWGQRGIHYHQFLRAGENTLNLQLGRVLIESLIARGGYDAEDYLQRYIDFMLTPGRHRDTYVEECHRKFFTAYARGTHPRKCGGSDIHIGGLAHVGVLCAFLGGEPEATRKAVREHVQLTHRDPEVLKAADALVQILGAVLAGGGLREAIFEHGSDWFPGARPSNGRASRMTSSSANGSVPPATLPTPFPRRCISRGNMRTTSRRAWSPTRTLAGITAIAVRWSARCSEPRRERVRIPARFCDGLHDAAALRRQVQQLAV